MRSLFVFTAVLLFLGFGAILLLESSNGSEVSKASQDTGKSYKKLPKRDRMDLAMLLEVEKTRDPALGYVPRERLMMAKAQAEKQRVSAIAAKGTVAGVSWTERGPINVGGRTRTLMLNPFDSLGTSAFAAGVSGGLWKTEDIFQEEPDWYPVNDFFDNLAIICFAVDTALGSETMYFGTGEGFFNFDAVRGDGIWKSTDGGETFAQLPSTAGDQRFSYVQEMKVHPVTGDVFAATRHPTFGDLGGLMRSSDGGATWTQALTSATTASGFTWAADVELLANGNMLTAIGLSFNDGIYLSADAGNSWVRTLAATANEARIEIATAPNDPLVAYALIEGAGSTISRIVKTTNGGVTWSNATLPTWDDCGTGTTPGDFTRGQAFYNLAIAVDPNDANTLMVGGIDLFKSTDGAASWTQVSNWRESCTDYQYVHADQHKIIYKQGSSDTVLFGNDGGVYISMDGSAAVPIIDERETNYRTTQYYSCALPPDAGDQTFLGGTQDNGSHRFANVGLNRVLEVTGGDGCNCEIDQDEPQFQFTTFPYNNYNRSTDGGLSFDYVLSNSTGKFINPFDYAELDNKIYASTTAGQYLLWIDPQTGNSITAVSVPSFGGGQVSAVKASQIVPERVFFGTDNGNVVRVDNAASAPTPADLTSASFPANAYVSCVATYPPNEDYLMVTFSNYGVTSVWYTINGGASWTAVEGDLPDMPVRWALFHPTDSSQALIATELGVWSTAQLQGGATDWEPSNNGLANVRTDMLQYRPSDGLVIAATHGRGMYSTDVFAEPLADFDAEPELTWMGSPVQFVDGSLQATSWLWDFGDGNISTVQHPTHTYQAEGVYTVTLTINGGADSETKTDFITILPNRGTPYDAADGGNFEVNISDFGSAPIAGEYDPWERGDPANALTMTNSDPNAWKTLLNSDLPERDYKAGFYTPSFNMTNPGTYTFSSFISMEVAFCNAPYGVQVQYSTDRGEHWDRLGTSSDANGTNWYNVGPGEGCQLSAEIFDDGYGWTFNGQNIQATYDVSFLAGNDDVAFRYVIASASGYSAAGYLDGFMVDDFSLTGPANDAVSLPVTLLSFDARQQGDAVKLSWATAAEDDNAHFEIERSVDGHNFNLVGIVSGSGTTEQRQDYSLLDNDVSSGITYYYRLADVSGAGQKTYAKTVKIRLLDRGEPLLTVYPSPTHDIISVLLAREGELRIYSANGVQLYSSRVTQQEVEISMRSVGLSNALYFISFTADDGNIETKRVILN